MPLRKFSFPANASSALVVVLALASCTSQDSPTALQTQSLPSVRPVLDVVTAANPALAIVPANATIARGGGIALRALNIDPINAKQATAPISWASSNTAVATVSSTGQVRALTLGTATITARTADRRFVATSLITVATRPNCERSSPLPTNLTGVIAPIAPTYEDTPHMFRLDVGDPDLCHRYTFRLLEVPVSGILYQVADDGTPRLDAIITDGMTISNRDGWVMFAPRPNYHGTDSFRYEVSDEAGGIYRFLPVMPLPVLPVNDAPVAIAETHIGANNFAVTNVLIQATDIDNLQPDICIGELPKNGDLYWNTVTPANRVTRGDCRPIRSLRYVSRRDGFFGCGALPPRNSYPLNDTFVWYASDGRAVSVTATGNIRIEYANHPPAFRGLERVSTAEDTPVMFAPRGVDPDGNPFVFVINTLPRHGKLWVLEPGQPQRQITTLPTLLLAAADGSTPLQYVPDADFNTMTQGDDFHLQLSDGDLLPTCDLTIRFEVSPVNDAATFVAPDRIGAIVALGGIGVPTGLLISVVDDARPTDLLAMTLRAQGAAAARIDLTDATGFAVRRISATEVRIEGTLSAINTLLSRGVQWTPNGSGAVYGELAISVDDRGGYGAGGPKVGQKIIAVDVAFETDGGLEGLRVGVPPGGVLQRGLRRPPLLEQR